MRLKKVLAGALALSMFLTPCVSMASPATPTPEPIATVGPSTGELEGEGSLEGYVVQEAFRVVLPTTSSKDDLKFKLDPQGLLAKTDDTYGGAEKSTEGWVVFNGIKDKNVSKPVFTTNKSSYPVKIDVEVTVENMEAEGAAVKFVDTEAKVAGTAEDGTDKDLNMYVAVIPYKDKYVVKNNKVDSTPAATTKIATDTSGTAKMSLVLDGYEENYKIQKVYDNPDDPTSPVDPDNPDDTTYTYKYALKTAAGDDGVTTPDSPPRDDTQWDAVGFTLTGNVNPNADWTKVLEAQEDATNPETMKMKVSYTVDKYDVKYDEIPAESWVDASDAYGLIKTSKNVLTTDGTNDIIIEYETAPTAITMVPLVMDTAGAVTTSFPLTKGTQWTATEGIVTIKKDFLTTIINNAKRGPGTYKVTVDGQEVTLTLEKKN